MPVQRILRNTQATLSTSLLDQYGEVREPVGDVVVDVTRANGEVVLNEVLATVDEVDVSVELPLADNDRLDELTCIWTEEGGGTVTTTVEVVGSYYFSIAEARNADKTLRDQDKYPDEDIRRVRQEVEEFFEGVTGRAFVQRYRRTTLSGAGKSYLMLPQTDVSTVRSVRVGGVAYSQGSWFVSSGGRLDIGLLNQNFDPDDYGSGVYFPLGRSNVVVDYEYGVDPIPADVKREAIIYLRHRLNVDKNQIDQRSVVITNEQGSVTLSTPGLRGARTGIPTVDECLSRWTRADWGDNFVGSVPIV